MTRNALTRACTSTVTIALHRELNCFFFLELLSRTTTPLPGHHVNPSSSHHHTPRAPSPPLPPRVIQPVPTPITASSPDSSFDDISLFTMTSTVPPSSCMYAEVIRTAPEKVPMMLAGLSMPTEDHWLDWVTCCRTYFANKETLKAKNYVTNVAGGIKPCRITLWYQTNHVDLNKLSFEEFLSKCMTKWLPSNWLKLRQAKMLSLTQGSGSFADLANTMINNNIQLDLSMDLLLRAEIEDNEKISAEKDLDSWIDLVIIVDEKHARERIMCKAEVKEAARKFVNSDKKCSSSTAGFNDSSHSNNNSNPPGPSQTQNFPSDNSYPIHQCVPPLTESEHALLLLYFGCVKCRQFFVNHNKCDCPNGFPSPVGYHMLSQTNVNNACHGLPHNHPLKMAQPRQPVTATHVLSAPTIQYIIPPVTPQVIASHSYPPTYTQPVQTAQAELPAVTAACLPSFNPKQQTLDNWFALNEASLDSNDSRFVSGPPIAVIAPSVPFLVPHLMWECAVDDPSSFCRRRVNALIDHAPFQAIAEHHSSFQCIFLLIYTLLIQILG
ncbi:hypothetical protein EDD18DRAFT_1356264 [Armillaria luteobubalina]|uniref:Uncharacterized protein n=1 Tax=Armillaria luteobubalina TaxID=153913 RepID=A0AA39Q1S7_9AGAR|nr:hypothetical protein EDD18DRAFT_1356264 [Armillaria luteobubalina]